MKNIFLVVNHISHLSIMLKIYDDVYSGFNNVSLILLEDKSLYLKKKIKEKLSEYKVSLEVKNSFLPFYGRNLLRNLVLNIILKCKVKKISNSTDILICMGPSSLPVYTILNCFDFPRVINFGVVEEFNPKFTRINLNNLIARIINFICINKVVEIYKKSNSSMPIYYYKYRKNIEFIVLKRTAYERNISKLPSISFKKRKFTNNQITSLLFIGSAYSSWDINENEKIKINKWYLDIISILGNKFKYYYIMHPLENGSEYQILKKSSINKVLLIQDAISVEFYLKDVCERYLCISVGSMGLISALNEGHLAKSFYLNIRFDLSTTIALNKSYLNYPSDFHLKSDLSNILSDYDNNIIYDDYSQLINIDGIQ